MRFRWTILAAGLLLAVGALQVGCGARRDTQSTRAPADPGAAPIESMEFSDDGLRLQFGPRVERSKAVARVLRCQLVTDPENPRMDRVACPVDIGNVHIDVAEGPVGVALTLKVDLEDAKALATWFEHDLAER